MLINVMNTNKIVSVSQSALQSIRDATEPQQVLFFTVRDLIDDGYSESAAYAKTYNDAAFYD